MIGRISRLRRSHVIYLALIAASLGACARPAHSGNPAGLQTGAAADRTVFTDSALFRRVCTQADSGLAPAVGRCTLRDQGVHVR
jgi:hypothetical protein